MKRFKVKKSGIKDNTTGLIWSKEMHPVLNWGEAVEYCKQINENGQSDWRLPSIYELHTIVDREESSLAIPKALYALTPSLAKYYWSSTTYVNNTSHAWYVFLYNGYVVSDHKANSNYVWPVRGEMK